MLTDHSTTLTTLTLFPPYHLDHLDHLDHQDQLEHSIHPDPEQQIEKFAKPFFWNKSYLQPKIAKKNLERNICEKVATVSKKFVRKVNFQALQNVWNVTLLKLDPEELVPGRTIRKKVDRTTICKKVV